MDKNLVQPFTTQEAITYLEDRNFFLPNKTDSTDMGQQLEPTGEIVMLHRHFSNVKAKIKAQSLSAESKVITITFVLGIVQHVVVWNQLHRVDFSKPEGMRVIC